MTIRILAILSLAVLLAGCGDDTPAERADDAAQRAQGDVIGGTISDDMLPLDRLRSQSPPLAEERASSASADGTAADEEAEDSAPPAEAAPEAEPAAEEAAED